jgi:hypothetical protein
MMITKKFRKKPVVIEAFQLTPDVCGWDDLPVWARRKVYVHPTGATTISTLEGEMRANSGDWIIRGVKGEVYPCKPDIFAATYEEVKEEN